jgi:hypothetical protein
LTAILTADLSNVDNPLGEHMTIHIAELQYPGSWIDSTDSTWAFKIQSMLQNMESDLVEAALALGDFEEAQARQLRSISNRVNAEDQSQQLNRRREIEGKLLEAKDISSLSFEERQAISEQVNIILKREQWAQGKLPMSYEIHRLMMHAKSFIYVLDGIGKTLAALGKTADVPASICTLKDSYYQQLPNLKEVRDSSHHMEDRVRSLGRNAKPLDLSHNDIPFVHAPAGGVLALNNLNGNRFGTTLADGHYGEVEISEHTLNIARDTVQDALDSFSWTGHPTHSPS